MTTLGTQLWKRNSGVLLTLFRSKHCNSNIPTQVSQEECSVFGSARLRSFDAIRLMKHKDINADPKNIISITLVQFTS